MNPVPPYTSLDMLRAMQREMHDDTWDPLGPYDGERTSFLGPETAPDPIGLSMMRLRPIERLHGAWDRIARISRIKHAIGRRPAS